MNNKLTPFAALEKMANETPPARLESDKLSVPLAAVLGAVGGPMASGMHGAFGSGSPVQGLRSAASSGAGTIVGAILGLIASRKLGGSGGAAALFGGTLAGGGILNALTAKANNKRVDASQLGKEV